MTWQLFDPFRKSQNDGNALDLDTPGGNGFYCALITSTLAPDQNTDQFWSDIVANECTGTDYTAGGNILNTPGFTGPTAGGLLTFDAADPAAWVQNTGTAINGARYAIIYHDTGTDSTSRLLCYEDMTTDRDNSTGPFTITFAVAGIFTLPRA